MVVTTCVKVSAARAHHPRASFQKRPTSLFAFLFFFIITITIIIIIIIIIIISSLLLFLVLVLILPRVTYTEINTFCFFLRADSNVAGICFAPPSPFLLLLPPPSHAG